MAAKCVVFQWRSQQDFEAVFQAGELYSYAMMFKLYVLQKLPTININEFPDTFRPTQVIFTTCLRYTNTVFHTSSLYTEETSRRR